MFEVWVPHSFANNTYTFPFKKHFSCILQFQYAVFLLLSAIKYFLIFLVICSMGHIETFC